MDVAHRAVDVRVVERSGVLSVRRRPRVLGKPAQPRAADGAGDLDHALPRARLQPGLPGELRAEWTGGLLPRLRRHAFACRGIRGGNRLRVCAVPAVAYPASAAAVVVLDAGRRRSAASVRRAADVALGDPVFDCVGPAGSGVRVLSLLSVDSRRALDGVVPAGPRVRPRCDTTCRQLVGGRRAARASPCWLPLHSGVVRVPAQPGGDGELQCRRPRRLLRSTGLVAVGLAAFVRQRRVRAVPRSDRDPAPPFRLTKNRDSPGFRST